jgi:hypothetical protein
MNDREKDRHRDGCKGSLESHTKGRRLTKDKDRRELSLDTAHVSTLEKWLCIFPG